MDRESGRSHNWLESTLQDRSTEPPILQLKYLTEITNNFSEERLLGKGGFGSVYKGVARNGDLIAVKKLTMAPGIQDRQFENEVRVLMKLKHPNIVKLLNYCTATENIPVQYDGEYVLAEKSERLLCLEYLPKGSLHRHLKDESSGLDWDTRYKIIQGICSGLHYLHEEWKINNPIVHMDLKPPNILLDDNMVPKIADFGLSRLFGEEQTRTCTKSCQGTPGYMAPEYINRGIITKKLDIFSLGVIIIEIITGCKEYPYETETSSKKFIQLVLKNWKNRLEKSPSSASVEIDCQQIMRCIEIGLACVKVDRDERPTTGQIIKMLQLSEGAKCSNERERSRSSCPAATAMHGEGQWNSTASDTGLKGTSQSCSLQPLKQYKRADLQDDNDFTDAEAPRPIFELPSRLGNRKNANQKGTSAEAEGLTSNGGDGKRASIRLRFLNRMRSLIFQGDEIKSDGNAFIRIGIFDGDNMITSGPLSKVKIEILALEGDFPFDASDSWTAKDFNKHRASGRDGNWNVLAGEGTTVWLINGEIELGSIKFREGSCRARKGKFILGARVCDGEATGVQVQEAIMNPVVVQDRRNKLMKRVKFQS